jgi:lipopolysaccharide/colanic/teichoic acid biosynthesis glycosyltransferase
MIVSHASPELGPEFFIFRERRSYRLIRKMADVVLGVLFMVLATPILAAAGVAIVLEDGPPVLFAQRRIGRFGRPFMMFKLRTMRRELCGDRLSPSSSADVRITRVGRVLRRLSIDEIPQLINVIRGDMSLVGPRPEMPFLVERYARWQHLRHLVPPGITCIWQTTHRKTIPLHQPEATFIDLEYVDRASLRLDFHLLLKTARAVFLTKGAF